ncbi:hypothetical protein GOODEAATRI_024223, partial [Goodea atripinnis]
MNQWISWSVPAEFRLSNRTRMTWFSSLNGGAPQGSSYMSYRELWFCQNFSSDSFLSVYSVSQHASGLQMEVFEGAQSVLLPCQVPVSVSSGSTAVWDRDDFRIPTVHVRQLDGDYLKDQNQRYEGRTSMMEDALQTGELSLTLRRPTFTDSGTFTCTVRRFGEDLHQAAVELQVR